jgi:uncharacterized metal-binding protein YceD (DUF177 family)
LLALINLMKSISIHKIEFAGLKVGKHQFSFELNKEFFENFSFFDFNDISLKVDIDLTKKSNLLELNFYAKGSVNVNCDMTNEPFDMPFDKEDFLVVKFGQEYNDEDNEILVLPFGEHKIILDQYLYELVILSLPRKRVHPGVEDGTLESEIIEILDELKPSGLGLEADPRWEKLKKIKNK